MKDLYPFVEEKIPVDAPEPKRNGLKITTEVDADHTHDLTMRDKGQECNFTLMGLFKTYTVNENYTAKKAYMTHRW